MLLNFTDGAVYLVWLGVLVGGLGIAGNITDITALGPALAIAFLPPLYGHFLKWIVVGSLDVRV